MQWGAAGSKQQVAGLGRQAGLGPKGQLQRCRVAVQDSSAASTLLCGSRYCGTAQHASRCNYRDAMKWASRQQATGGRLGTVGLGRHAGLGLKGQLHRCRVAVQGSSAR